MTARQQLRQQVYRACLQYVPNQGLAVLCSWCGKPIENEMDLHEYLVKRSAVIPNKQPLIMVPENLAPLHPACHMSHGQASDMAVCCLHHMGHVLGLRSIGEWYVALWQKHGLSVPRGILIAPRQVSTAQARNYYERGRKHRADIPEEVDELQVGYAMQTWHHKRPSIPENGHQALRKKIESVIDDGYWLDYLEGVIGQSAADSAENHSPSPVPTGTG
jgi:hypothetical protein